MIRSQPPKFGSNVSQPSTSTGLKHRLQSGYKQLKESMMGSLIVMGTAGLLSLFFPPAIPVVVPVMGLTWLGAAFILGMIQNKSK